MQARLSSHKVKGCLNLLCSPKESPRYPPHQDRGPQTLDTSRGGPSSILQKVTITDSSRKLIGIPISLCQLAREAWSPTSPAEVFVLSCQA